MRYLFLILVVIVLSQKTQILAQANELQSSALAAPCQSCHGVSGRNSGEMPTIDSFDFLTLRQLLLNFKNGELTGTIMGRIMKGFSDEQINSLAKYFSQKQN
ncbi:MAG: sulfide dehydrogenase cytochrome subunit [Paracoccaceae bacterium]|jgi:sulfide dehydrogenase cytochrome subunit